MHYWMEQKKIKRTGTFFSWLYRTLTRGRPAAHALCWEEPERQPVEEGIWGGERNWVSPQFWMGCWPIMG